MIFAVVWGSIIFVGQNAFRGHNNNHNTTSGLVMTAPARTPAQGSTSIVVQLPLDP